MKTLFKKIFLRKSNPMKERVKPWFEANGDKTLRLDYDLDENSIVFDLGGYHGNWAAEIFCKYGCFVHIFEPAQNFTEIIKNKFIKNKKIFIHQCGLSNSNTTANLSFGEDASSTFAKSDNKTEEIKLVDAMEFFKENNISKIDLMKINIEGGEYDLLEYLIETGYIAQISNIQVQFHDFAPNAIERMKTIQQKLQETHSLTYQYEFVWENWQLKQK